MRKRTRDGYTLNDGSVVKTSSANLDPRNVHGCSKATLVRRLAYKHIRDPEVLFSPPNTLVHPEEEDREWMRTASLRQLVKER